MSSAWSSYSNLLLYVLLFTLLPRNVDIVIRTHIILRNEKICDSGLKLGWKLYHEFMITDHGCAKELGPKIGNWQLVTWGQLSFIPSVMPAAARSTSTLARREPSSWMQLCVGTLPLGMVRPQPLVHSTGVVGLKMHSFSWSDIMSSWTNILQPLMLCLQRILSLASMFL